MTAISKIVFCPLDSERCSSKQSYKFVRTNKDIIYVTVSSSAGVINKRLHFEEDYFYINLEPINDIILINILWEDFSDDFPNNVPVKFYLVGDNGKKLDSFHMNFMGDTYRFDTLLNDDDTGSDYSDDGSDYSDYSDEDSDVEERPRRHSEDRPKHHSSEKKHSSGDKKKKHSGDKKHKSSGDKKHKSSGDKKKHKSGDKKHSGEKKHKKKK